MKYVCWECGNDLGEKRAILFSWRTAVCEWCCEKKLVTDCKDFGLGRLNGRSETDDLDRTTESDDTVS